MGALPEPVERLLKACLVAEFTVVDPAGRPVTHPMIPIYDGEFVYVTSSVLFSKKLEHVKRDPKVALAVTDPVGVRGVPFHRATVQGDAEVLESDLHAEWERIMPLWAEKEPAIKAFYAKRVALPLFFERSVIRIRPRRVLFWEGGRTDRAPQVFEPTGVA